MQFVVTAAAEKSCWNQRMGVSYNGFMIGVAVEDASLGAFPQEKPHLTGPDGTA
jgi:hypothetical protein